MFQIHRRQGLGKDTSITVPSFIDVPEVMLTNEGRLPQSEGTIDDVFHDSGIKTRGVDGVLSTFVLVVLPGSEER